jgi:hypothetical protein
MEGAWLYGLGLEAQMLMVVGKYLMGHFFKALKKIHLNMDGKAIVPWKKT